MYVLIVLCICLFESFKIQHVNVNVFAFSSLKKWSTSAVPIYLFAHSTDKEIIMDEAQKPHVSNRHSQYLD